MRDGAKTKELKGENKVIRVKKKSKTEIVEGIWAEREKERTIGEKEKGGQR